MNQKTKGIILILISSLAFGSYGVWSRLMGDSFGVFFQGWTRGLIIALILFPILYVRGEIVPILRKDWKWLSIFLLFTSATQAPIYYAFNHMDIGTATLIFFVTMLITMYIFGFMFLGEKITKIKIAAFILALVGLFIIFPLSFASLIFLAAAMALLNGVASGGEVSSSKRLTGNYSALYIVALGWLILVPTNGILSVALGEHQVIPAFNLVWLYQLGYVTAGLIGFWFIIEGLKYVDASIGGLLGLLEILFSIAFGVALFGEDMTARMLMGAFFILCAAALPHVKDIITRINVKYEKI